MEYLRTIVCLADSRKMSGRCIAGREYGVGGFGPWIRPVSNRPTEELAEHERRYADGTYPRVFDIIAIPMLMDVPHTYQSENHLIDARHYWERRGRLPFAELVGAVDTAPGPLWVNGYSSTSGLNDRVPLSVAESRKGSLRLLGPLDLEVTVRPEGIAFGDTKRKLRAGFLHNGERYRLRVTDPVIERAFLAKEDGAHRINDAYLCVSLGEPFNDHCYKLVASILTADRA